MFRKTTLGTAAALAALAVAGPAAAHVDAGGGPAVTPTTQALQADIVRGEALNRKYHLGAYASPAGAAAQAERDRGYALNARYGNAWTRMPSQQFSALVDVFGGDVTRYSPAELRRFVADGATGGTSTGSNGFEWRDATIGGAGAIGIVLLGSVLVLYARSRRPRPTLRGAHTAV